MSESGRENQVPEPGGRSTGEKVAIGACGVVALAGLAILGFVLYIVVAFSGG
jgi:hypothetical protein